MTNNNKNLIQIGKTLNASEIHKKATIVIYNKYNTVFPALHIKQVFGVSHKRVLDAFKGKAPALLFMIDKYVNSLMLNNDIEESIKH